jgi:hypothetical protein
MSVLARGRYLRPCSASCRCLYTILRKGHPYITFRAALDYLKTIFPELILVDQDCFASENGSESLLELVPDVGLVQDLREAWSQDPFCSSQEKWADLKDGIQKLCDKKGSAQRVRPSICFHAGR